MEQTQGKKIAKNAFWIIICKIVQSVLSLVVTMFTSRYLGPSNYGLISYAASIVAFLLPLMQLGLTNVLVQESVQHPEEEGKIYGTSMIMSFISSLFCILATVSFAMVANASETVTIVVCGLYSLVLIFQALEHLQYWFQSKYKSKHYSVIALIAYVIVSAYRIILLVTKQHIYTFAVANAIDYAIISLLLYFCYKKLGGQKLKFDFAIAKRMFAKSKYYIISSLMVTIFAQTDKIMITLMLGNTENGYYSAAVSSASLSAFVFAAIIDSFRPAIFENQKESTEKFEKSVSALYSIIIYFSLIQCVAISLLANPIIKILFGNDYDPAINALRLIVWYTTFAYLGSVRNIWILAQNKQKYLWIINLSGAVTNVILNAIFIPIWGIMGAAFASLVTQIFTNVIIGFIIKPIIRNNVLMLKGLNLKNIMYLRK